MINTLEVFYQRLVGTYQEDNVETEEGSLTSAVLFCFDFKKPLPKK
ncbi:hypothetical protein ACQKOM_22615 [Peribacillus frigoritolerans]